MRRITRTWEMMGECWQVLMQDKSLLMFPMISCVCCSLLLLSFAAPLYLTGFWHPPAQGETAHQVAYYGTLFAFYVCNYLIVIFFNAAIVSCVVARLGGADATLGDGLRAALNRLPAIAGWALVCATVGMLLRIIEERSGKIGRIISGILGAAWTAVSFMVVPILVVENKGPFEALKDSTILLKKTWGERLTGGFSFGLIFFLLSLPGIAAIVLGAVSGNAILLFAGIALGIIYLMLLALVQSTLHSIFQAVLYLYTRNGQVPEGFRAEVLSGAMG